MFKAIAFSACAVFACAAAQNNLTVSFSSVGPDRYQDGSIVKDKECYALVWTKSGAEFAGFLADGSLADAENSSVVLVAPVAKGGRCPPVAFDFDASIVPQYEGGSFGVYLLDTRDAEGAVLGVGSDGKARAVNGFGVLGEGAEVGVAGSAADAAAVAAPKGLSAGSSVVSATGSEVPAAAPSPVIKKVEVVGGNVYVTVGGTVPYLQYNVSRGATPSEIGAADGDRNVASPAQGKADGEIILVTPAKGASGFMRVNRN